MPFSRICRAFVCALALAMAGVFLGGPAAAQTPYGVVKNDSHTLSSAGDTATTTFASNVSVVMIDANGGDIHYAFDGEDASDTDFPKFDDQPPLILEKRWVTSVDVVSDAGNGSAVTVWIRGLK